MFTTAGLATPPPDVSACRRKYESTEQEAPHYNSTPHEDFIACAGAAAATDRAKGCQHRFMSEAM